MTRFIIIAASLALACNAIETGECVLGSEASCGGLDSSALLQGRLRVNEEDAKAVEISINTDLARRNAILTFTVFSALTNVTRTSSKVGFHHGYADESEVGTDDDWEALHSHTEGLRNVMTAIGAGESCPAQSADGDYSHLTSIKLCVDHALCIMCQNVTTQEDNKACTMLRELYGHFEDTTWGYLWKSINLEKVASEDSSTTFSSKGIDYMDPTELACKGIDLDEATASFAEINSKATAHQASAALVDAARTTHALLDSHQENSSVDATIAALQRAWEPPCELLNCDHTNYWDLVGASFSHSIALIESGASSHHMQVHLRTRQRLEIRMGAFLAANGMEFASKIYRTDGTSSEAQMNRYVSHLVVALTQKMTNFLETYGPDSTILSLYDRDYMKKFLKTPARARLLQALYDGEESIFGRRRRRRNARRRLVHLAVGGATSTAEAVYKPAAIAYGDAVSIQVQEGCKRLNLGLLTNQQCAALKSGIQEAVRAATKCTGAGVATTRGYGKKFPNAHALRGMAASVSAGIAAPIQALLDGSHSGWMGVTFSLGVVIGLIPGDSHKGGVRVGLGIALILECSNNFARACNFGITVGAVAAAVFPKSSHGPDCIFGPNVGTWGCFAAIGVTVKILCCTIDLTNGCQSCDPNEHDCGAAEPAPIDGNNNVVSRSTIKASVGAVDRSTYMDLSGKVATQSSTRYGGSASRAIDGNTASRWGGRSCTHTSNQANPWWEVNLGSSWSIKSVKVTNRGDCCGGRLNGFTVSIDGHSCATGVTIAQGETKEVMCSGHGKVIRVSLPGKTTALTICEFAVMQDAPCCQIVRDYNMRPSVSWGTTPEPLKTFWLANKCDNTVGGRGAPNCCCQIVRDYNMRPHVSWGTTPEPLKTFWLANKCDTSVGGRGAPNC